jgi:hypothetical protein
MKRALRLLRALKTGYLRVQGVATPCIQPLRPPHSLPDKIAADPEGRLVTFAYSDVGTLNSVIELWRYPSAAACIRCEGGRGRGAGLTCMPPCTPPCSLCASQSRPIPSLQTTPNTPGRARRRGRSPGGARRLRR